MIHPQPSGPILRLDHDGCGFFQINLIFLSRFQRSFSGWRKLQQTSKFIIDAERNALAASFFRGRKKVIPDQTNHDHSTITEPAYGVYRV